MLETIIVLAIGIGIGWLIPPPKWFTNLTGKYFKKE